MTLIAPTLQAFFSERLVKQLQREPAHDRLLPRHAELAAALRAGHDRQGAVSAGVGRAR